MQNRRSHIGEYAVFYFCVLVSGNVYEGYGVERVGSVGSAVGVYGFVGVAVVGDDDYAVAMFFCGFDNLLDAVVDSLYGSLDG